MAKRGLIIGSYYTNVRWILAGWSLDAPEQITDYVDVPGRLKGPLDLSTALTDGDPVYGSRLLEATFECSEGTRMEREAWISEMTNSLDGFQHHIVLPDDPLHYLVGRVTVTKQYNDLAHASVRVTAMCEPWRYNIAETMITLTATETPQTATLPNSGRLAVMPELTVTGGDFRLVAGANAWTLGVGTYMLPDLLMRRGGQVITYSGSGVLTAIYREAVL